MATLADNEYADPLTGDYTPERVNYATGVMLQADDFQAEQTYHRSRLAQLIRHLMGFGTLAGLKVLAPPPENNLIEIRVQPGVAVDRYGRMIEIRQPQCIELARWFAAQQQAQLRISTHAKPRIALDKAVVADVFLSAHGCGRGKTPSFASGPFDALDALVASRVAENAKIELVLRSEGGPAPIPQPANFWPKAGADAKAQLDAVMGSWDRGIADLANENLKPLTEHVQGRDYSALLLARIAIPVTSETDANNDVTTRLDTTKPVLIDNSIRPFIYLPGKWFGQALS